MVSSSATPMTPEQLSLFVKAAELFTPSAPIDDQQLFAGRTRQLQGVITAIAQKGQHVILFGERGTGKTSLSRVTSKIIKEYFEKSVHAVHINCDGIDDFDSLWKTIFHEAQIEITEGDMPNGITPEGVRFSIQKNLNSQQQEKMLILIIDELNELRDSLTTQLLADTIKTLSDHCIDCTLILVGVADNVEELIAEHLSIERALVQILMPRMKKEEVFELMDKRLEILGITIDPNLKSAVMALSQGLPSYVHLLSLHSAQSAISANRKSIETTDLQNSIGMAVQKAQHSIVSSYHKAVSSNQKTLYPKVLLACCLASKDELGCFTAAALKGPMKIITGKSCEISTFSRHLNAFCEEERGPILSKRGDSQRKMLRFFNPVVQPYVIMHGISKGYITYEQVIGESAEA